MNDFTRPAGRIASLSTPVKFVYSTFAVFTLAALVVSMMLMHAMVGIDLSKINSYYAGVQDEPKSTATVPKIPIDVPSDLGTSADSYAMPTRKLLEVTHFHLFSMPLYLLVLSHLYALTRARSSHKVFWISLASLSTVGHLIAPWLARQPSMASTWLYGASGTGMLFSYGWMCIAPLIDMWIPRSNANAAAKGTDI